MEELIQAVLEAMRADPIRPDGTFTTKEFYKKLNNHIHCSEKRAVKILSELKEQGRVEVIKRIPIKDISDRPTVVRGWKWTAGV